VKKEIEYISSSQLIYLIIGIIQGSTLTLSFVYSIAKQDTWLVMIVGFIVTMPLLIFYVSISKRFPGKNLIEINEKVYGKFLGSTISILYIAYFLLIVPYNTRYMADFFNILVFPDTPTIVFIILFVFICSWAVREGIEVIARCSPVLVFISFVVTGVTILLLLGEMKLSNFLPVLQLNIKQFVQGTHIMIAIPFGEIIVFLMINCNVKDVDEIKRSTIWGLVISTLYMIIIVIRSVTSLGILTLNHVSPSYQVLQLINVGNILTRLESFTIIVFMITIFIKVSIFFYATVLSIAELFKLPSYKILITPLAIIMISLSVLISENVVEASYVAANIYPILVIPIQILIPILTLILARKEIKAT
jgi:spore germination protein KB